MNTVIFFKKISLFLFVLILCTSFLFIKKDKVKLPKSYKKVEAGTLNIKDQKHEIASFYMYEREVTNLDYKEFLHHLKQTGKTELYEQAQSQPDYWSQTATYCEPLKTTYHIHPAYDDYPINNISQVGARLYCEWLTQLFNSRDEKHKYEVRLPTENEWIYAAKGGHDLAIFPWGGYYLRNSKGRILCNFKRIGESNISFNHATQEYIIKKSDIPSVHFPAPALSYLPNDFGLYNMSGNVAEMLQETGRTKGGSWRSTGHDVRIDAEDEFAGFIDPSPMIGFRPVVIVTKQ